MQKKFCDACDTELKVRYANGQGYKDYEVHNCITCYGEYHEACLQVTFGQKYCKIHAQVAENRKLISEYVAKVWSDMGYPGEVNKHDGHVAAQVGPLNMSISPEFDLAATNLAFVNLNVRGLTSKIRTFKASLCEHETIVKQLQGAIVRSLRSTKSSITQKKKQMDEDVTKLDALIAELMGKLGGVMPDDRSISEE